MCLGFASPEKELDNLRADLESAHVLITGYRAWADRSAPLLEALRSADPQTLPEPIAKLVAAWKAET